MLNKSIFLVKIFIRIIQDYINLVVITVLFKSITIFLGIKGIENEKYIKNYDDVETITF